MPEVRNLQPESHIEIPKSYVYAKTQTGIVTVAGMLLFFLTSYIVRIIDNAIPIDTSTGAFVVRLVALALMLLAISVTWFRNINTHYYIDGSSIIIQSSKNLVRASSRKIIKPKGITKITMDKTMLGKAFNYGCITIQVGDLHKTTYKLNNVLHPEKIVAELQARLQK